MSLYTPLRAHTASTRVIPLTPEIINAAKQKLSALYGDDVFTLVLPGHPIAEINRYARNKQMSLIVVGEQGLAVERDYGQCLSEDAPCTVMTLTPRIEHVGEGTSDAFLQELVRHHGHER